MYYSQFTKSIFIFTVLSILFYSCNKNNQKCDIKKSNGRIIGFDPCRYYTPSNNITDGGFVIEINNLTSKDTVVCYSIPSNLFDFPEIDASMASNGQFLYEENLQNQFTLEFDYYFVTENERKLVICRGDIYTAQFDAAIKSKEIKILCFH